MVKPSCASIAGKTCYQCRSKEENMENSGLIKPLTVNGRMSGYQLYDAEGDWLCECANKTDADEIVRAVNSHEALVKALEMGNDTEDGPALLRRVASMVFRVAGPVTAAELRRKADAEEAALAKAQEA
jgi:hypothetical protein